MERAEVTVSMSMDLKTQDAEKQAKKTAEKVGKTVDAQMKTASKGISAIGSSLKLFGDSIGNFGGLGKIFSAGKIGLIIAAFTALAKAIENVWDNLTLSTEEKLKKIDIQLKNNAAKQSENNSNRTVDHFISNNS